MRAEPKTANARWAMVDNQIRTYDVTDQRVLQAFSVVPRELFLPSALIDLAYSDASLTVGEPGGVRRAMLVPMVLARMFQGLDLDGGERILVVAAGTGYAAAIAAELCGAVVALESDEGLVAATRLSAASLGYAAFEVVRGPLDGGYPAGGPYDAILICGGVERDLTTLLDQLASGGRLLAIQTASHEATRRSGKATRYDRLGGDISSRVVFDASTPVLEAFRQPPAFVF